ARLLMLCQIEVRAVGDPFELAEAFLARERECVFDVAASAAVAGIVSELVLCVITEPEVLPREAELAPPIVAGLSPELIPFVGLARVDEELDLHHLELARAEDEVS